MLRLALVAGLAMVVLAVAAWILVSEEISGEECTVCHSTRMTRQWAFSAWSKHRIPLSPERRDSMSSRFYEDYLQMSHHHDWVSTGGNLRDVFGGFAGCALGSAPSSNDLARAYERSDNLRACLAARVRSGELTPAQIVNLLSAQCDRHDSNGGSADESRCDDVQGLLSACQQWKPTT